MPKRRAPASLSSVTTAVNLTDAQVEAFAAGADQQATPEKLDPDANRDFKGIRVGFNEYEYRILEEASRRTGRSKLNYIRHAVLTMAKQLEPE
jgi:hypothetical protein